jgi:hypothetical protein
MRIFSAARGRPTAARTAVHGARVRPGRRTPIAMAAGALAIAVLARPGTAVEAQRAGRPPSTDALVDAAVAYVTAYQQSLEFVVAEETSTQSVLPAPRAPAPARRVTHGEMFLTYLSTERQWTSVHDVWDVDGIPIPDREDLAALLRQQTAGSVARRVFDRNARFNIGSVRRNFNDPMLALLVLGAANRGRFSFSQARRATPDGPAPTAMLTFRERDRPTIITGRDGRAVFSRGDVMLDPATGAIRRTRIALEYEDVEAELVTAYAFDAGLALWVPSVFTERYESRRSGREVTTCESTYTNYRRFDVSVRIR